MHVIRVSRSKRSTYVAGAKSMTIADFLVKMIRHLVGDSQGEICRCW